jgi:hypothetical protein
MFNISICTSHNPFKFCLCIVYVGGNYMVEFDLIICSHYMITDHPSRQNFAMGSTRKNIPEKGREKLNFFIAFSDRAYYLIVN